MLVEIVSLDNGSGVNTNLDVYLSYNEKQKLFELRPYCKIDIGDFYELLNDKQIEQLEDGKFQFRVSKTQLSEIATTIY